jgi:hypothetical protein
MEDLELDRERDAAAGEVLPGNHKQLHEFVRTDLRRDLSGLHLSGWEQRDGGERDGGRDAE